MQRRRLGVLVAGAAGTAMLSLLAMVAEQAVGGGRGMRAELDLVTRMNGYTPNGVVYSEGQMPLGLGAASGICPWGFCPQRGDGVEVNPREAASSLAAGTRALSAHAKKWVRTSDRPTDLPSSAQPR